MGSGRSNALNIWHTEKGSKNNDRLRIKKSKESYDIGMIVNVCMLTCN